MINDFRIAKSRLLTHSIFWLSFLAVSSFVWGYCFQDGFYFSPAFESKLLEMPVVMGAVYTNMYILLPRLLVPRKYLLYLLCCLLVAAIGAVLIRLIYVNYLNIKYPSTFDLNHVFDFYYNGKIVLLNICPALILTTIIKLCQYWYYEQRNARELMKEKMAAELNYLKAQVHPHFLFNTLNNLYSLTLVKSEQAPPMVLKLSELMSYMLYDSQGNRIALEKEVAHLNNFIELEKIRYGQRLDVSLNVHGNISNVYVPPLLLIPFVENAFKHGASNETKLAWITIDLKIKENSLAIKVENSKSNENIASDKLNYRNGIGLRNVERRLALLYPGKYDLSIEDGKDHYAVDLKLALNEN